MASRKIHNIEETQNVLASRKEHLVARIVQEEGHVNNISVLDKEWQRND